MARAGAGSEAGVSIMKDWLRETWRRIPSRGKLAIVAVFVGAGLLFWLPQLARAVHPAQQAAANGRPERTVHTKSAGTWRNAEQARNTQPLLRSASPEELARDPFSIEGFLTGQTGPAEDHVPQPRDLNP
jgi:hypothetical protein